MPTSSSSQEPRKRASDGPLVLVIDDEPFIRDMLERVLADAGYRVATVASAFHGGDFLEAHHADVRCVIADQKMKGPAGLSVLERCKTDWPNIGRVMYVGDIDSVLAIARARHWVVEKGRPLRALYAAIERSMRGEYPKPEEYFRL